MNDFQERQPAPGEEPQLQGLLFTGEVIRSLTPERLEALGHMVLSFGVEMKLIHSIEQTLGRMGLTATEKSETEKSTPVRRKDFVAFATEYGYPKMRAWKAWSSSVHLAEEPSQLFEDDTLIPILLLRTDDTLIEHQVVELGSIYARLKQSRLDPEYYGAPDAQVKFLAHLCNEMLQLDEPLHVEDI